MVANVLHHLVELQAQVVCHVERLQVVLEGDAAILLLMPFQCVKHHKPEAIDQPCLQTDIW